MIKMDVFEITFKTF